MHGENCGGLSNYSRTNGDCLNYDSRLNGQVNHVSAVIKRLITFLSCNGLYIGGRDVVFRIHRFTLLPYSRAAPPQSSPSRRRHAIAVGRAGSPKPASPRVPARDRGRIRFLGSAVRLLRWSASSTFALFRCRQPHCKNV